MALHLSDVSEEGSQTGENLWAKQMLPWMQATRLEPLIDVWVSDGASNVNDVRARFKAALARWKVYRAKLCLPATSKWCTGVYLARPPCIAVPTVHRPTWANGTTTHGTMGDHTG